MGKKHPKGSFVPRWNSDERQSRLQTREKKVLESAGPAAAKRRCAGSPKLALPYIKPGMAHKSPVQGLQRTFPHRLRHLWDAHFSPAVRSPPSRSTRFTIEQMCSHFVRPPSVRRRRRRQIAAFMAGRRRRRRRRGGDWGGEWDFHTIW